MVELGELRAALEGGLAGLPADAVRLFHGRGHCYPGLEFINIDWFRPVVWVVLYGEVAHKTVADISHLLQELAANTPSIEAVAMQHREAGKTRQTVIYGQLPQPVYATEQGMRYELNLSENQNIGFFLDAMPARQWVREHAAGKRVLNLFAYTCSFSVAALQGGAGKVVNIDMAKGAIATGQRNHRLNPVDHAKASFLPHDIFRSIRKLQEMGPYDLVIVDPPSFQKGSFEAGKDWVRLLKKLGPMLAEDAVILACLNAPYLPEDFLATAFADALPEYALQQRLPQRADFPEKDLDRTLKMHIYEKRAGLKG